MKQGKLIFRRFSYFYFGVFFKTSVKIKIPGNVVVFFFFHVTYCSVTPDTN